MPRKSATKKTQPAKKTTPKRAKRSTQARAPETRQRADFNDVLLGIGWGGRSASGDRVTSESALTYSAVLACVRVLAESVASLPLITYRRTANGGKERASTHPLYPILHNAPNPEMTSLQWRETSMVHLTLWGNAYSEIVADGAGRVRELWPLLPQWMTVKRIDGAIVYEYREPGVNLVTYPADQILHVTGLSLNGLVGMTPIAMARETIGLGLTLNQYGGKTFANETRAGGVLEHPGTMGPEAYDRLKNSFNAEYSGSANAGKTILLEEGTKFSKITMPNDDAQFLESRKFQIEEVARIFRMQPHMIGSLEHATFSNIEHQSLEFVRDTLRPWLVRWEQSFTQKLYLPRERDQFFSEFLVDGLLRGDIQSRYNAYNIGRNGGWLSRNDIRALENMNPIDGGDDYLTPLNMTRLGAAATAEHDVKPQAGNGTRHKVAEVEDDLN